MIPKLLEMIDNTTNWYIRFNRKRLKGEYGTEDTLHALNSLFEVLFILVRALAPFTPFLSDNIYLRLRPYIPKELLPEDDRSVHFLSFPEVRTELFDEDVERRVARMQKVIELNRVARDRKTIGLKVRYLSAHDWGEVSLNNICQTPLKTLIVIHPDPSYLDDIKSLEPYITAELNVRDLILSSDESKYNIEYQVEADWPVLGKKLKKDAVRVRKALPSLTSEECKNYVKEKELVVEGIKLEEGDLVVLRRVAESDAAKGLEANTDNDVLTILDTVLYPELQSEGLAREIVNRVQRLRKKAGLVATDDVKMEYHVYKDPIGLADVFVNQEEAIVKALRRPLDKANVTEVVVDMTDTAPEVKDKESLIMEEEQEINGTTFLLRLLRL